MQTAGYWTIILKIVIMASITPKGRHLWRLVRRLFTAPKESYFLFGPRGTGKSTWLRQSYPDAIYIDLLDQEVFRKYLAGPERLGDVISGSRSDQNGHIG